MGKNTANDHVRIGGAILGAVALGAAFVGCVTAAKPAAEAVNETYEQVKHDIAAAIPRPSYEPKNP